MTVGSAMVQQHRINHITTATTPNRGCSLSTSNGEPCQQTSRGGKEPTPVSKQHTLSSAHKCLLLRMVSGLGCYFLYYVYYSPSRSGILVNHVGQCSTIGARRASVFFFTTSRENVDEVQVKLPTHCRSLWQFWGFSLPNSGYCRERVFFWSLARLHFNYSHYHHPVCLWQIRKLNRVVE